MIEERVFIDRLTQTLVAPADVTGEDWPHWDAR
jgi:hypothetical protein